MILLAFVDHLLHLSFITALNLNKHYSQTDKRKAFQASEK